MTGVYECRVIAQTEAAPGVFRMLLAGPEIAREVQPGQFVNVRVAEGTDPLLRRPFSVHTAHPSEGVYSLLYMVIGRGTTLLREKGPGEMLSVVGPLGRPFDPGDSPDAEHIVVAGGCGAAPLQFLSDVLCAKWGSDRVTALAGAATESSLLCEAHFASQGVQVGVSTEDGSRGDRGLVTDLLQKHLDQRDGGKPVRIYSCGPNAMMRQVARVASEAGVEKCQVSLENNMACGLGLCLGCVQKIRGPAPGDTSGRDWHYERVCKDGPVFDAEDIIWD